jgi:NtrC-family two-component system sensor histidine kinase KinB
VLRSLRARILAGYGLALLLVAVVLAVALGTTSRLGASGDALLRRNYVSIRAADGMADAVDQMHAGTLLARAGDPAGPAQATAYADSFRAWLGRAQANVTEPGERESVARLDAAFRAYRPLALGTGGGPPATTLSAFQGVRAEAVRLRTINQTAMVDASGRTRADARRAFRLTLGVGLAALAAGLAFSLALASALVRPLRAMREAADAIGRGRYDVALPAPTDDDLGGLARAMGAMAHALRDYDALNVDRLLAEKRKTEAVLQAMDDGLVVVDAGMRVATSNPAAERVLGPLVPGRLLDEAVHDRRLVDAVRTAFADGRGSGADAAPRFVADAAGRHVQYVVSVLGGPPGGAPAAILLLRDLTRLQEAERLKSDFVRAASHELRTPLTGLGMALGMLRGPVAERLDERDQELLDVAVAEQGRLSALVSGLLDLAQMEAGHAALDLDDVDVRGLLDEAASRFAAQAEAGGATVDVVPGPALPPVRADAGRLALVLSNLVANALRYVGPGGHVRLSAGANEDGVQLSVTDDGPGIPVDWSERVFDPLAQVDDGRAGGSSGLGLSVARAIVRAHGGSIRIEEAPGTGACFLITLPSPGLARD